MPKFIYYDIYNLQAVCINEAKKEARYSLEPREDRDKLVWVVGGQQILSEVPKTFYKMVMKRPAARPKEEASEKKEMEEKADDEEQGEEEEEGEEECPQEEEEEEEEEAQHKDEEKEEDDQKPAKECPGEESKARESKGAVKNQEGRKKMRVTKKRPHMEVHDWAVGTIYFIHAATGKNIRAYLLAKGEDKKSQIVQVSHSESRKYHQITEKLHKEAIEKVKKKSMEFGCLKAWASRRKAELLG